MAPRVRMLWRRSASLTSTTRHSALMARRRSRWLSMSGRASASVTPVTMRATWWPKRVQMSSASYSVSSTTSCRRPATIVSLSMRSSARMHATSTGWMTNGSPDLRHWPSCASMAKSTAASMSTSYASRYPVARRSRSRASASAGCDADAGRDAAAAAAAAPFPKRSGSGAARSAALLAGQRVVVTLTPCGGARGSATRHGSRTAGSSSCGSNSVGATADKLEIAVRGALTSAAAVCRAGESEKPAAVETEESRVTQKTRRSSRRWSTLTTVRAQ
mmetsp:Transcript_17843/g.47037  ORF Transcript_17843/g.47037 Transcript_17843/m.47037 type:complete len:275 (-) Transcript_17843:392-1216(-)